MSTPARENASPNPARASLPSGDGARDVPFEAALDAVADGVWDWEVGAPSVHHNPRWYELTGYRREELDAHEAEHGSIIHPEDCPRIRAAMNAHLAGRRDRYDVEFRVRHKNGQWRWLHGRGKVVARDDVGRPLRVIGADTDITARKEAERAADAGERRMQLALDAVSDGVWDAHIDADFTFMRSAQWYRLTGYDPLELAQHEAEHGSIIHPDDRALLNERFLAHLHGAAPAFRCEFRIRHKSGEWRWLLGRGKVVERDEDGRPVRMIGTDSDITDAKQAEQALRESEARYRMLTDGFPDGALFLVDREMRYLVAGGAEFARVGLRSADLMGLRPEDVFPPDVAVSATEHCRRALDSGEAQYYEVTYRGGLYSNDVVPIRDAAGAVRETVVITRNITQQRADEIALRRVHAELNFHMENSPLAVLQWDACGRLTRWSRTATTIFGWEADEVVGKTWGDWRFVHEDDAARVAQTVRELFEGGRSRNVSMNRNYARDGRVLHCEWYNSALHDEASGETSILSLVLDVTDQRELEEQLRQSQKLEAIGQLAGGVAHDFNNILTAILGHVELLRTGTPPEHDADPWLLEGLGQIERAGQRAASLTRQLLVFSRKQIIQPRDIKLNHVVADMEKMLRRLIPEHVELVLRLSPDEGVLRADPGQIEQVVLNLVVNARDAMPEGGQITIETGVVALDDAHLSRHPDAQGGPHARLTVRDGGRGMDEKTRTRIFEPFFTTKPAGEGTGLGLATVHGIVRQAGGHIAVDSRVGVGTTFSIYLPLNQSGSLAEAADETPAAGLRGDETVLVCEDDPAVRSLTTQALSQQGYRVLSAPHARAALRIVDEEPGDIPLLVSDVVMPGMSGPELAAELRRRRPQTQILFVSGYPQHLVTQQGLLADDVEMLQKPFATRALLERVRTLLDRAAKGPDAR